MIKSFISPARYVQGAGALEDLSKLVENFGDRALVIIDPGVEGFMKPIMEKALENQVVYFQSFGGESTQRAMEEGAEFVRKNQIEMVVGVGGGKAIDTAKGVAYFAPQTRIVVIPTIVASDAPCSKNAVVYTEDHCVDRDVHGVTNPDLVLIDSNIIANAPTRYLSAGIGDALATWLEAEAVQKTMIPNFTGYSGTFSGFKIAELCFDTLLENAPLAVLHNDAKIVTPQLDAVIEANSLMSTIGFESGGLASAHGFHQGIAEWEETHSYLHGEKVAIGILASLFLTHKDQDFIDMIYQFHVDVRLPITLEDIGVKEYDDEKLMVAVKRMMQPIECTHNEPVNYTEQEYLNALKAADAYGKKFKEDLK